MDTDDQGSSEEGSHQRAEEKDTCNPLRRAPSAYDQEEEGRTLENSLCDSSAVGIIKLGKLTSSHTTLEVNYNIKGQKVYLGKYTEIPRTKLEAIINTLQTKTNKHQIKTDSELAKQKTKQTIIINK